MCINRAHQSCIILCTFMCQNTHRFPYQLYVSVVKPSAPQVFHQFCRQPHKSCRLKYVVNLPWNIFFSNHSVFPYFCDHKIIIFNNMFAYEKMEKAKRKGHRRRKKRELPPSSSLPHFKSHEMNVQLKDLLFISVPLKPEAGLGQTHV